MTKNQIEYAKHLETRRANRENEALTRERDLRAHSIALRGAAETERANRAKEVQAVRSLDEQVRSNLAKEGTESKRVSEIERGNKATEAIKIGEAAVRAAQQIENVRSNLADEAERKRHNLAMEVKPMQPISTTNVTTTAPAQPLQPITITVAPDVSSTSHAQPQVAVLPGNTSATPRLNAPKSDQSSRAQRQPKPTAPTVPKTVWKPSWNPITGLQAERS